MTIIDSVNRAIVLAHDSIQKMGQGIHVRVPPSLSGFAQRLARRGADIGDHEFVIPVSAGRDFAAAPALRGIRKLPIEDTRFHY
jgi:hypothetical protein